MFTFFLFPGTTYGVNIRKRESSNIIVAMIIGTLVIVVGFIILIFKVCKYLNTGESALCGHCPELEGRQGYIMIC